MKIKTIGIVTATNAYEKEGVTHASVSVGCGREAAFNIPVRDVNDWYVGDVVVVRGDLGIVKGQSWLRDSSVVIASSADRQEFGYDVRRRPDAD